MSKQALVFASCSLGILFLCGFSEFEPACLAQSSRALDPPPQQDPAVTLPVEKDAEARRCLESTCRNAPLREKLTAINLGTKRVRGIVGGFEQGAGIGGGVQLSSADTIPSLELRATALASSRRYRRFDLEGYVPNIRGSRNHADVWFSYMQRQNDFFGIGPQTSNELTKTLGREPSIQELAKELKTPVAKITQILKAAQEPISLEASIADNKDAVLNKFIEDKNAISPDDDVLRRNLREVTNTVLESLSPREQEIVRMRYGLNEAGKEYTLQEVGEIFQVTRERIRQIEEKALLKLRSPLRSGKLREFSNYVSKN